MVLLVTLHVVFLVCILLASKHFSESRQPEIAEEIYSNYMLTPADSRAELCESFIFSPPSESYGMPMEKTSQRETLSTFRDSFVSYDEHRRGSIIYENVKDYLTRL